MDDKINKRNVAEPHPTWDDDVAALFSRPYWTSNPEQVGSHWISIMREYSPSAPAHLILNLAERGSVEKNIITIYQHLRSRSMPITKDHTHFWPFEALETLRNWANQGFRKSSAEPLQSREVIPAPEDYKLGGQARVRKDIRCLTPDELQLYREKLDDMLGVGRLNSHWQELGLLHAEWCLHYQEAFIFWHRAYLRYVEELIDFPIPYWNGFAADTSDPTSPSAGLPSIFLEETYVHSSGQVRKNPLKYALSLNGENKAGTGRHISRFSELEEGRTNPRWLAKVHLFELYHRQIAEAFSREEFSLSEGHGYPWANVPDFSDDQPDGLYPPSARQYFDGLFEQVHDNYHGWIGHDMADNSYTAFDPIFLSYHCNMDRIAEMYLQQDLGRRFSSNFPLRPFVDGGTRLAYHDPQAWRYVTIGDMAKPTVANRFLYAQPATPDYLLLHHNLLSDASRPSGGTSLAQDFLSVPTVQNDSAFKPENAPMKTAQSPYVIFTGVACIKDTFQIDVFVRGFETSLPDPIENPYYIGRITRLGMGNGRGGVVGLRNSQRCEKKAITRVLSASHVKDKLVEGVAIEQIVTELHTNRAVDENEWRKYPGFFGKLVWMEDISRGSWA
ncbi:Di-copper centre-containing protein [Plenodomus tracheiphilus IPT5]|uniref:tyrosinase n=1 Tax=Plenodomus tracheiphilus IPT5 TaxID=1408161 RepID=A0A6A7AQI4_9PLEO|nr:Di-copper centre-containing protein [Plenodomus tracheiphilus IPT5]